MNPMMAFVLKFVLISQVIIGVTNANVVFNVQHKLGGRSGEITAPGSSILKTFKAHDAKRHGRMLAAVDFQLGGNGITTGTGMFYTKLSIGTPPKDYLVSVDTGSNDLWLHCAGCDKCPKQTNLGFNLTKYDLKSSSTGKAVSCHEPFCAYRAAKNNSESACTLEGQCKFWVGYGDSSETSGYYVRDSFKFDKISGDLETSSMDGGNIAFGCGTKSHSDTTIRALDGLVGFGQKKSSIINQLASDGKTKRIFSHCVDSVKGGGIFAIGEVVDPKLQTTPIVPGKEHYNARLERIEVGGSAVWNYLNDAANGTKPEKTDAVIDCGTTLAYFPGNVHDSLVSKVMEKHPGLKTYIANNEYTCFKYSGNNIDSDFPVVSLHFENSAILNNYPHDYLFKEGKTVMCFGFLKTSPELKLNGKLITLLGNTVLADKLIVYDLDNMTMGWTNHNCSSTIKVKDDTSGNSFSVAAHDILPPSSPYKGRMN